MDCSAIENWSLGSLVGAYIDLVIAALLLSGAAFAFLASKLLGLFGLSLPCPQYGLFGRPSSSPCLHRRLLVDRPADSIAAVHSSLLTRFPFDSIISSSPDARRRLRLLSDDDNNSSPAPLADDSRASVSHNLTLPGPPPAAPGSETSSADSNSKIQTTSLRRRRRRRRSFASAQGDVAKPPPTIWRAERSDDSAGEGSAESSPPTDSGLPEEEDEDAVLPGTREAVTIRELERALEEEQAARARLYRELEEERSAAATAADEAMAMILRLQEEKGTKEMELRQYHRMIDEKSAFDEEEMEILKEIVVRREMEKHFLEKELEGYRQMMVPGGRSEKPLEEDPLQLVEHPPRSSVSDSMEDPVLMLHQIYESLGKRGTAGSKKQFGNKLSQLDLAEYAVSPYHGDIMKVHSFEKHRLDVVDSENKSSLDFQEKTMLSMDVCSSSIQGKRTSSAESSSLYNEFQALACHKETLGVLSDEDSLRGKNIDARVPVLDLYREGGEDADQKVSDSSQLETESRILDVYVIDDRNRLDLDDVGKEKEINLSQKFASDIYGKHSPAVEPSGSNEGGILYSSQDTSWGHLEQKVSRSCSDMTRPPRPMDNLSDKSSPSGLKRRSMSAIDGERSKLEIEVEILRKRLKVIQQGREKLSFTREHKERESFQLQLLEEIARQLQEIRKLTEPGKSERQASLPPPSSKASTKKRRCRSASQGLLDST